MPARSTKKGRTPKSRKKKPTKTPVDKVTSDSVSSPATEESSALSGHAAAAAANHTVPSPSQQTPMRCRQRMGQKEAQQTSTPIHTTDSPSSISSTFAGEKSRHRRPCLQDSELFSSLKMSEEDSPCSKSTSKSRFKKGRTAQPRQILKTQRQTCSKGTGAQRKPQRGSKRKTQTGSSERDSAAQPSKCRPRFELQTPEEPDDSVLSSDLSIELSHHEDQIPFLSFQEEEESDYEEDDDDDELPSYLTQADKKPSSITDGAFVWHKFRNCPFWPALVKHVNRKLKKASIMYVYDSVQGKKGFTVALKTLKPFDCEEYKELVCQAKEKYGVAIELSVDLIEDYRMRKACGSFSGSFIEYCVHDMSYPVRRKYPQAASEMLSIGSDAVMDDSFDDHKEDCSSEQLEKVSRSSKRLLPDRTHAAHNRANEKLVHFIVKQHMVDEHILAVIRGQQQSRWLRSFLSTNQKRVVDVYLEDEKQLDQVYKYLNNLYNTAVDKALSLVKLKSLEHVPFVLDVLLPEAIIYAIAGVDNVSIKKAEEKYLKGRRASPRERQEFDQMIEQHMRIKAQTTALVQPPEPKN